MGVYQKWCKSSSESVWFIDYRFDGRRLREKIGPSKALALSVLRKRKVEIAEGKFLEKRRELQTTLTEMAALYIESYAKQSKRTWDDDKRMLDGFVEYFGNVRLSQITPLKLEAYRADHYAELKPATLNRRIAALKTMYSKAIEWGKATENPALKIKLYPENNARTRFLEKGEIPALLAACPEQVRSIVEVALCSGMRKAEVLGLTWDDVDFANMMIRVRDSKNKSSRYIPMSLPVLQALRGIRKDPDSPYVFANSRGRTFLYGQVRYAFEKAVAQTKLKGVVFHTLRHTAASHMVMAGVDLSTVAVILGHKSTKMTERYSHLSPGHKTKAIKALDGLLSGPTVQMDTQVDKPVLEGPIAKAEAFAKIAGTDYLIPSLLRDGEMVSQRTLNPLF